MLLRIFSDTCCCYTTADWVSSTLHTCSSMLAEAWLTRQSLMIPLFQEWLEGWFSIHEVSKWRKKFNFKNGDDHLTYVLYTAIYHEDRCPLLDSKPCMQTSIARGWPSFMIMRWNSHPFAYMVMRENTQLHKGISMKYLCLETSSSDPSLWCWAADISQTKQCLIHCYITYGKKSRVTSRSNVCLYHRI